MIVHPTSAESIRHSPVPTTPVIGFVGGVGSGKSTLARWVAAQLDAGIIDADAVGHQVLLIDDVRSRLRKEFGDSVFDHTGQIDRPALSRLVFGEDDFHREARRRLEAIVHPEIRRMIESRIQEFRTQPGCPCILLDAAVLFEAGWQDECDWVIFVDAPRAVRQERAAARGWDAETHRRREASQLPLEQKQQLSDFTVCNAGDIAAAGSLIIDRLVASGLIKSRCKAATP